MWAAARTQELPGLAAVFAELMAPVGVGLCRWQRQVLAALTAPAGSRLVLNTSRPPRRAVYGDRHHAPLIHFTPVRSGHTEISVDAGGVTVYGGGGAGSSFGGGDGGSVPVYAAGGAGGQGGGPNVVEGQGVSYSFDSGYAAIYDGGGPVGYAAAYDESHQLAHIGVEEWEYGPDAYRSAG